MCRRAHTPYYIEHIVIINTHAISVIFVLFACLFSDVNPQIYHFTWNERKTASIENNVHVIQVCLFNWGCSSVCVWVSERNLLVDAFSSLYYIYSGMHQARTHITFTYAKREYKKMRKNSNHNDNDDRNIKTNPWYSWKFTILLSAEHIAQTHAQFFSSGWWFCAFIQSYWY